MFHRQWESDSQLYGGKIARRIVMPPVTILPLVAIFPPVAVVVTRFCVACCRHCHVRPLLSSCRLSSCCTLPPSASSCRPSPCCPLPLSFRLGVPPVAFSVAFAAWRRGAMVCVDIMFVMGGDRWDAVLILRIAT